MKNVYLGFFIILFICSCSSSETITVDQLLHDQSFNPSDFFNNKIVIYSPFIVQYSRSQFPETTDDEFINEFLKITKNEIEEVSKKSKVIIKNKKAPDYFQGLEAYKKEDNNLLKSDGADFVIIIQGVFVADQTKTMKMIYLRQPKLPYTQNQISTDEEPVEKVKYKSKEIIQSTVYYDVWDTKSGRSVLALNINSDLNDSVFQFNPYLSLEKITRKFIEYVMNVNKQNL